MNNLGLAFAGKTEDVVQAVRTTSESKVSVTIDARRLNGAQDAYSKDFLTGLPFFDHMLYGVASRALLKISARFEQTSGAPKFAHVVCEDVGLTLGAAVREMLDQRKAGGVEQRGFFQVAFDDGLACATLAFDGRPYCFFQYSEGLAAPTVEGLESSSLKQFFEGFAIGAGANLVIESKALVQMQDAHHAWEAVFKAFGEALRQSISRCPAKAGKTIGLKGTGAEAKMRG